MLVTVRRWDANSASALPPEGEQHGGRKFKLRRRPSTLSESLQPGCVLGPAGGHMYASPCMWDAHPGAVVSESHSAGSQIPCEMAELQFREVFSEFSSCSTPCGGGLREQPVLCAATGGFLVSQELCSMSPGADAISSCNMQACASYRWEVRRCPALSTFFKRASRRTIQTTVLELRQISGVCRVVLTTAWGED